MNNIFFYKPEDGNFWLTNFSQDGFWSEIPLSINNLGNPAKNKPNLNIKGEEIFYFKTAEHLFQCLKISLFYDDNYREKTEDIIKEILKNDNPNFIKEIANNKFNEMAIAIPTAKTKWFDYYRENAMKFVLKKKFGFWEKNNNLRKKLLDTENSNLIEKSPDKFWGNGSNDNCKNGIINEKLGENKLGELLMNLRKKLIFEEQRNYEQQNNLSRVSIKPFFDLKLIIIVFFIILSILNLTLFLLNYFNNQNKKK